MLVEEPRSTRLLEGSFDRLAGVEATSLQVRSPAHSTAAATLRQPSKSSDGAKTRVSETAAAPAQVRGGLHGHLQPRPRTARAAARTPTRVLNVVLFVKSRTLGGSGRSRPRTGPSEWTGAPDECTGVQVPPTSVQRGTGRAARADGRPRPSLAALEWAGPRGARPPGLAAPPVRAS